MITFAHFELVRKNPPHGKDDVGWRFNFPPKHGIGACIGRENPILINSIVTIVLCRNIPYLLGI